MCHFFSQQTQLYPFIWSIIFPIKTQLLQVNPCASYHSDVICTPKPKIAYIEIKNLLIVYMQFAFKVWTHLIIFSVAQINRKLIEWCLWEKLNKLNNIFIALPHPPKCFFRITQDFNTKRYIMWHLSLKVMYSKKKINSVILRSLHQPNTKWWPVKVI